MLSLREISADLCESCTKPASVFKQSFDMAQSGEKKSETSLSQSMGALPALENKF